MERFYSIKLRRYRKGQYGRTTYGSAIKFKAISFADGYAAALRDLGMTDLHVSVHDEKGRKVHDA